MATHTKTQTKSKTKNAAKTSQITNGSSSSFPVHKYKMYINGEFVEGSRGKSFPVYDPSTEQIIAQVPEADEKDVKRAVAVARAAFDSGPWNQTTAQDRGRILFRLAERVRKEAAHLANLECRVLSIRTKAASRHNRPEQCQQSCSVDRSSPIMTRRAVASKLGVGLLRDTRSTDK
jgi:hypothetical protein